LALSTGTFLLLEKVSSFARDLDLDFRIGAAPADFPYVTVELFPAGTGLLSDGASPQD
jgi:hypothetical protein